MSLAIRLLAAVVCLAGVARGAQVEHAPEEFNGPFPSWKDLKRDYGADGNGQVDDTAAIQKALDELTKHKDACVLYVPAGTYRVTKTLSTVRKEHSDCQDVTIVGEDPETTIIQWDGAEGGTLLNWDAWYSKISRLTLDGKTSAGKRAGNLLVYGPAFSTYNETSDMVFRDAANGLVFGGEKTAGQAENEVLRCHFLRCDVGLQTVNWNSMDIWVWYCHFADCDRGVHNAMGNWHVWKSVFERSKTSDLSAANLMVFSVVENVSVGSACFLNFDNGHTWGSPTSITSNHIFDTTGDWAIRLGNAGPYLVADNYFRLSGKARAIKMTWGDQTLVGNTYSVADPVEERGRFRRIQEHAVEELEEQRKALPIVKAPIRTGRLTVEVRPGADADTIQKAIDEAYQTDPSIPSAPIHWPVVHLPMGTYKIDHTIVIPAGKDVQIIGDGAGETATRLEWTGPPDGVMFLFEGPCLATIKDVYLHLPQGRGIEVTNVDSPRGRLFADQLNVSAPQAPADKPLKDVAAIRFDRVRNSNVLLRALQGSGNGGTWVDVVGVPAKPTNLGAVPGQINIFTGASGSANGQYRVREGGSLTVRGVYHERSTDAVSGLNLTGAGTLSIDATRFSYATSEEKPTIQLTDYKGLFTLATSILLPVPTKATCAIATAGDCKAGSVLAMNDQFWIEGPPVDTATVWKNNGRAQGGLVGCSANGNNRAALPDGMAFFPNIGDAPKSDIGGPALKALKQDAPGVTDETILRHLQPLRTARSWTPSDPPYPPIDGMDMRIHRVLIHSTQLPDGEAVVLFRGGA